MVEPAIVGVIQKYLEAVQSFGIRVSQAILFGSYARGDALPDSDVDILVIAPEFDGPYDKSRVDLLWVLRADGQPHRAEGGGRAPVARGPGWSHPRDGSPRGAGDSVGYGAVSVNVARAAKTEGRIVPLRCQTECMK